MPLETVLGGTAGVPILADKIGATDYMQAVKLDGGADGVSTPIVAGQRAMAASLPVVIASDQTSLAMGGSVTATFTGGLPAGTNNIGDVDVLTLPGIDGSVAHDGADAGNPVKIGGKARNAFPTAVANGDRTDAATDLFGRLLIAQIDPAMQVHKQLRVTSIQTGSDVWSPTSGKRIAVTSLIVASDGTTAARVILWFGDNADTTFTAGTDQVLFAGTFKPSATASPGVVYCPATPIFCTTADRELHLTTDAGISLDITVEGYEF